MVPIQEIPHAVAVSISRVFYRWLHNIKRGIELLEILAAAELYKTDLDVDSAIRHIKILLSTTREDIDQTQLIRAVEILGHAETLESFDDKISLLRREIASFNNNASPENKSPLEVEALIGNMDQREDDGIPYHLLALLNTERPIEQDIPFRAPLTGDDYTEIDENGNITLHGGARVNKLINIPLGSVNFSSASLIARGRNIAASFSHTVNNYFTFEFSIPTDMDYTLPQKVCFYWSCGATTGEVKWVLQYLWFGPGEDTTSSTFDKTITELETVSGTADVSQQLEIELTVAPSSTDKYCIVSVGRLAAQIDDTAADNSEIVAINVVYGSNNLGESI